MSTKRTLTLKQIADVVGKIKGHERGVPREGIEWWVGAYEAMEDGECVNTDSTLEDFLEKAGKTPQSLEATIQDMMK